MWFSLLGSCQWWDGESSRDSRYSGKRLIASFVCKNPANRWNAKLAAFLSSIFFLTNESWPLFSYFCPDISVSACVKDQRHTLLDLRHIFTFYFLWSYFQFVTIVHDMLLIFFVGIFLKIQFRPLAMAKMESVQRL